MIYLLWLTLAISSSAVGATEPAHEQWLQPYAAKYHIIRGERTGTLKTRLETSKDHAPHYRIYKSRIPIFLFNIKNQVEFEIMDGSNMLPIRSLTTALSKKNEILFDWKRRQARITDTDKNQWYVTLSEHSRDQITMQYELAAVLKHFYAKSRKLPDKHWNRTVHLIQAGKKQHESSIQLTWLFANTEELTLRKQQVLSWKMQAYDEKGVLHQQIWLIPEYNWQVGKVSLHQEKRPTSYSLIRPPKSL
ncbi:MAG: hypothetical protein ACR2PW_02215 [Gammaproteobacteria bacterium]